jgi:hypothetical protein
VDPKPIADAAAQVASTSSASQLATIIMLIILAAKAAFDLARLWYVRSKVPTLPGFSTKQAGLVMRWLEEMHKNIVGDSNLGAEGLAKRLGGLEGNMEAAAAALQASSDSLKEVSLTQKAILEELQDLRRLRNGRSNSEAELATVLEGLALQLDKLR